MCSCQICMRPHVWAGGRDGTVSTLRQTVSRSQEDTVSQAVPAVRNNVASSSSLELVSQLRKSTIGRLVPAVETMWLVPVSGISQIVLVVRNKFAVWVVQNKPVSSGSLEQARQFRQSRTSHSVPAVWNKLASSDSPEQASQFQQSGARQTVLAVWSKAVSSSSLEQGRQFQPSGTRQTVPAVQNKLKY